MTMNFHLPSQDNNTFWEQFRDSFNKQRRIKTKHKGLKNLILAENQLHLTK